MDEGHCLFICMIAAFFIESFTNSAKTEIGTKNMYPPPDNGRAENNDCGLKREVAIFYCYMKNMLWTMFDS
jgi:hypothetical protein